MRTLVKRGGQRRLPITRCVECHCIMRASVIRLYAALQCEPGCTVSGNHLLGRFIKENRMTKKFLMLLVMMLLASSMLCAQTPGDQGANAHWKPITAGFAMAIASSLCGLAQGKAIAAAVEGMARNPGAAKGIQLAMLIGLAFIESLALYTLLICFVFEK